MKSYNTATKNILSLPDKDQRLNVLADKTLLNFVTINTIIQKHMKAKSPVLVDYDLADEMAWEIASQIPSDVLLPRVRKLMVHDILNWAEGRTQNQKNNPSDNETSQPEPKNPTN